MVQASEPFEKPDAIQNPAKVGHLKTAHVRFSDPHCTWSFCHWKSASKRQSYQFKILANPNPKPTNKYFIEFVKNALFSKNKQTNTW